MTLGERLQQLRKEKQMSQEELGNLLLVSRQTVSLWENNQTVPTVENLIRLKEIYGVNVDFILTGEDMEASEKNDCVQTENTYEKAEERCSFSFDKKELKYMYKIFTAPLLKRLVIWIFMLCFAVLTTFGDVSQEQSSYFFVILAFIFFSIALARYICGLFATKKNADLVCSRIYTYEIFSGYILVRVANEAEEIKTQKVYFSEIAKCWETPCCYFIELKSKMHFLIKKSALEENSRLSYLCQSYKTDKTDFSSTKVTMLKTAGSVLFIGSFIAFFAAAITALDTAALYGGLEEGVEALGIFHYFLPIPILSIVVGILLIINKVHNKRNIICGVVIGLLMLVYGLFPTIIGNANNNFDSLEAMLGFDFPQTVGMNYQVTADADYGKHIVTTLTFDESVADDFEKHIRSDERWIKGGNDDFSKMIPEAVVNFPADFFVFYNVTTDEFGKIPQKDIPQQLVYVGYSSELNVAYVCQYQLA